MSKNNLHKIVYDEVILMLQKADNPGLAMREWLITEVFEVKDVIEICTALAISYRGAFDEKNLYKIWYIEGRDK